MEGLSPWDSQARRLETSTGRKRTTTTMTMRSGFRQNKPHQGRGVQGKADKCPPAEKATMSTGRIQFRGGIKQTRTSVPLVNRLVGVFRDAKEQAAADS